MSLYLKAYEVSGGRPFTRAPETREWMTSAGFPLRCLPLIIANQLGWELLCPYSFQAQWSGGSSQAAIKVEPTGAASSHFGLGTLTFATGYVFRTSPGYDLIVRGPANEPKDGIQALDAVVETDWSPYPFTMNWKFTRPGTVYFEKGEPFALLVPYPHGLFQMFEASRHSMREADPEWREAHEEWSESRGQFLGQLKRQSGDKWQKDYFLGRERVGSEQRVPTHQTRLNAKQPQGFKAVERKAAAPVPLKPGKPVVLATESNLPSGGVDDDWIAGGRSERESDEGEAVLWKCERCNTHRYRRTWRFVGSQKKGNVCCANCRYTLPRFTAASLLGVDVNDLEL